MKIDKGVPMLIVSARTTYPFPRMEVGDSFFIAAASVDAVKARRKRVTSAAHNFGKHHSKKFATRTVDGGVRCWRIE